MKLELQEHHIAEIRDKIDNWPASRLNAKDVRDDCRKLLEHIEYLSAELREAQIMRCTHISADDAGFR
jgi:hypothetical protein